jgi:SRSO17 transposase
MYATPITAIEDIAWEPPPEFQDTPLLNLKPEQVDGILDKLSQFWQYFAHLFQRREQSEWGVKYISGHFMEGEKYFTSNIAHSVGEENERAMQNFIGASPWDDQALIIEHQSVSQETIGHPEGCIIMDGSGFPRKGTESAGIGRQYCNATGKIDNCQVGVYLAYATPKGYTLLDRRLHLPEEWFSPEYAIRCRNCGIPEETNFHNHQEWALEMLQGVHQRGKVTFQWILGDEDFGRDTWLLDQVADMGKEDGIHYFYFMQVPANTRVWLERPETEVPTWKGRGRPTTRRKLVEGEPAPQQVDTISLQPEQYVRYTLHEGSKGPLVADVAFIRVVAVRNALPGPEVWLVIRHDVISGERRYYLSNAPEGTPQPKLAWLSAARWPVERSIEDCKDELRMNQYSMRSWHGWYHHMTLVMIAHLFLVTLQQEFREQAPALTISQARMLLKAVLPRPVFDVTAALKALRKVQICNHRAYLSNRRRTLRKLKMIDT